VLPVRPYEISALVVIHEVFHVIFVVVLTVKFLQVSSYKTISLILLKYPGCVNRILNLYNDFGSSEIYRQIEI
jgi:hypothetical protein